MRRATTIALVLLMPALAIAQNNPFKPKAVGQQPEASVFLPTRKPAVVIPPPIPLPPADVDNTPVESVPAAHRVKLEPSAPCLIDITPRTPLVGAQGGEFTLRLKEGVSSRGCVVGIESRAPWLKIRFFNGEDLALYAEPNEQPRVRHGEIIFANATNSLVIRVVQAAP